MNLNQNKINEYVNDLAFLTDLDVCIYFDGYYCSKHCKECKGRIDDPSSEIPCQGKDYKTLVDNITDRLNLNERSKEQCDRSYGKPCNR